MRQLQGDVAVRRSSGRGGRPGFSSAAAIRYAARIWRAGWDKLGIPRWVRWVLIAIVPLCLLNMTVSFCGHSAVFPLSPFFLREKTIALARFARHLPGCLLSSHAAIVAPELIAHAEGRHRLPRGFLAAVIDVESDGRVHRISRAGAMGPAQLAPATARALRVTDPFDPFESVDGAARYLATQLATFHDVRLAAAAYNAGPGAIVHRAVPHNGETEIYVARVMRAYAEHRRAARRH